MAEWVLVGDKILNVDNIEFIEKQFSDRGEMSLKIYMSSNKIVELTNTTALTLWKYLDGDRLKFYDLENPKRDFSGT